MRWTGWKGRWRPDARRRGGRAAAAEPEVEGVDGRWRPDARRRRGRAATAEPEIEGAAGREEGWTGSGGRSGGGGGRAAMRVGRWGAAAERDRGEVGERRVGLASEGTGELWIRQWWTGLGRIV